MNSSMGESYQDRVRYYRRKSEQQRAARNKKASQKRGQSGYGTDFDFDEALYNFKNKTQFEKMYSNAKRHAHKHAKGHLAFYRNDEEGYLGGVCAGIADKMNWDVKVVRLLTVISGLVLTIPTVVAYIAATMLLRNKRLAFHGRDERSFWKQAAKKTTAKDSPTVMQSDIEKENK